MKIILDNDSRDYVEIKEDNHGNVNLSIRTKKDPKTNIVISAKLTPDLLDKLITGLVTLRTKL